MADLAAAFVRRMRGGVDASVRRRAEYSSDASNYRVVPQVVVFPLDVEDTLTALEVAREVGVPVTPRGAGTSVAGNAVGPGVVVDMARHQGRVLSLDAHSRTARIQPGVVLATLQAAAAQHGLRFGPDPSTMNRATLGGMIGNNACGAHALAYGRTADNVVELDVVDGTGRRFTAGNGANALSAVPGLAELVHENLATIRTDFGRFSRQVSGYSLEHLLPERGNELAKMMVGTEGTLVTVLEATVNLVEMPRDPVVVALGYPDTPTAADAVPELLLHGPLAMEGLDSRLVDAVRSKLGKVPYLPQGAGWLLVELGAESGESPDEVLERARRLTANAGTPYTSVLPAGAEANLLWQIRSDGAGLGGRTPSGAQAWPGWEDAAVPPNSLGQYLRDFAALMNEHDVDGMMFGHFGDGCMHVRLDLPLHRPGDGVEHSMRFLEASADLVVSHGGSLSGEHGDGRARSALLPRMYSLEVISLFEQVKGMFDAKNSMNPGVLVDPAPVAANLRRPAARPILATDGFAFLEDGGDLTVAAHRCTGLGKCRADTSSTGGFMCPSYRATRDEKDVTRGRARVLQELTNGSIIADWNSKEVAESLDLCLSCKACSSECPAGVDIARLKSEVLHRSYQGRRRPVTHYALGQLPRWSRIITQVPGLARIINTALRLRALEKLVLRVGGMDPRRRATRFATERFETWFSKRPAKRRVEPTAPLLAADRVVVWTDSFSATLDTAGTKATVSVLESAGFRVEIPARPVCCGLTWISTGQLKGARSRLQELVEVLHPYALAGVPVVGVEPSCLAVLRSDLVDLLPGDPRAASVAANAYTLVELLASPPPQGPAPTWQPPSLSGLTALHSRGCSWGLNPPASRSARAM